MFSEADLRDIYGNEEECRLYHRENVVKRLKTHIERKYQEVKILSNLTKAELELVIDQYKKQNEVFSKFTNEEFRSLFYAGIERSLKLSTITNEELMSASEAFLNLPVESFGHSWVYWSRFILYVSVLCKDWKKRPIPVKVLDDSSDVSLGSKEVPQRVFAILTTTWIAAGGLFQFFIVLYLFRRRDSPLQVLPKWMRILLHVASLILLGPVVVYVFGVFFVMKNIKRKSIHEDIQR